MHTLIPVGNQLVVKAANEDDKQEQTARKIIVPDAAKKSKNTGTVVALSGELSSELRLGDKVIYRVHSATEIEVDNQKYLVLPFEGVLVIVR
jgi:chaperonin GroES